MEGRRDSGKGGEDKGGMGHVSHGMMETAAYHTVGLSMCVPNVLEGTEGICVRAGRETEKDRAYA